MLELQDIFESLEGAILARDMELVNEAMKELEGFLKGEGLREYPILDYRFEGEY